MRKRVPVLKDGKVLRDENGKVLEFDAVNQEELDRKIDAPQVAKVGEVLTVEEVDTEGKPKKWKTQTVETEPPDWNENDPTKPGYVKNRTHYDSRLENVELFNVTVENTSLPFIKVADVGIDVTKIVRIKMNVQVSVPDEGVRTIEVDSDEGEITQNDVDGDGSQIVTIIEKTTGDRTEQHILLYFKTNEVADKCTGTTGIYTAGLYVLAIGETIKGTFVAYGTVGELCTLNPKYIKDMYYTETGYGPVAGYEGWALLTDQSDITIPLMEIQGTLYKNVPVSSNGQYVYVNMGDYRITFDRGNRMCYTSSDSITADDIIFYVDYTTIHQIPDEYIPDTLARKGDLIQSNWNITDPSSLGFINNKPNLSYQSLSITSNDNLSKIGINTYNNMYERCTYFELLSATSTPSNDTKLQISSGKISICPLKMAIGCDILIHCTRVGASDNHTYLYYIYIFEHKNIDSMNYSGSLVCFKIVSLRTYTSGTLASSDGQTLKCNKVLQYYK